MKAGTSGEALTQAANRLDSAAAVLSAAQPVVESFGKRLSVLGTAIDQLAEATPKLATQASSLADVEKRLRTTSEELTRRADPIVSVVRDSDRVVADARNASETAAAAMALAGEQVDAARQLAARSEVFKEALQEARTPFVEAAQGLRNSTGEIATAAGLLSQTVEEVRTMINRVNWLALVADGLRHDGQEHREQPSRPGPDGWR